MIKRLPTLTIGIPAYNEERSLRDLLAQLSKQDFRLTRLTNIIIYSDGSTDRTVEVASQFSNLPTSVINQEHRKGKAYGLNQIIKKANTDVLVLLDADVVIRSKNTVDQLAHRLLSEGFDLCAPKVLPLQNRGWMANILIPSLIFKNQLFEKINAGNNIYTCHGRARAFSKRLYSQINFKDINEDAYSYLFCQYHNYKYQYLSNLIVYYHLPTNLPDHSLQSTRFFQSKKRSYIEFGENFVKSAYSIPKWLFIKTFFISSLKNRMLIPYAILTLYLSLKARLINRITNTWTISKSSKNIKNIYNIKDNL